MPEAEDYARQKQAFFDLLDLPPAERDAALARVAAESPALAAALHQQLAAAEQAVPLLDGVGTTGDPPRLANYRLLHELGRGGMGVVWLAERTIGDAVQKVALKQISRGDWDAEALRRFQRERRILAALEHPHIAALVDGGTDTRGRAFLATQYIDGERLDHWQRRRRPDLRTRVRLLADVAAAVAHAHAQLVVHRDLKPANILVTGDGLPKLLDFGIARELAGEAHTVEGPSQMTLRYAAPEQVASEGGAGGTGVDVYALGVLLYEAIAETSPYGEVDSSAGLLNAILHAEPRAPSRQPAAQAGADADLDAICLKALRKTPEARYRTMQALRDDLEHWLRREPVEARRGERGYRLRALVRRRWPWLAAACLVLAALAYHLAAQRAQIAAIAVQRDKAQALAEHFGELFESMPPGATERGEVSARALLKHSVARLLADASRPPSTRAALLLASSQALDHLGDMPAALNASREALRLATSVTPADADLLAAAHSELASTLYKTGDTDAALREARAGIAQFQRGADPLSERHFTLQQQVAMFAEETGDREGSRAAYQALIAQASTDLDNVDRMETYLGAQVNLATGDSALDPAAASTRLREALAVAERHGYRDPAMLLPARGYLAVALFNQRLADEARAVVLPLERDARAYFAANDPWLGLILGICGNFAAVDGRGQEAVELLEEGARIAATHFEAGHDQLRVQDGDLAIAYLAAGNLPEARRRVARTLEWLENDGRAQSALAAFMHATNAYLDAREQRNREAFDALRRALEPDPRWNGRTRWIIDDWRAWLGAQTGSAATGQ